MMLAEIHAEFLSRINATHQFLQVIEKHENSSGGDFASKTGKGLIFIQNYSTYEYTINQSVRALITELNSRTLPISGIRTEILSLALHSEFATVIGGALKKTWDNRLELLQRSRSATSCIIHDSLFPKDGSQYRPSQIETIWKIFGIPALVVPQPSLRGHIDEMVNNRNKIAHGSDSAASIGQRFTTQELTRRINDTEAICSHIVASVAAYGSSPNAFQ